MMKTQKR